MFANLENNYYRLVILLLSDLYAVRVKIITVNVYNFMIKSRLYDIFCRRN